MGFYGHPEPAQRHYAWTLLRRLRGMSSFPWMIVGDFNQILSVSEKFGGSQHSQPLMEGFCDALDDCELEELGYTGPCFTWSNRRDNGLILERLDRSVCCFA